MPHAGKSFVKLVCFLFTVPNVKSFLSQWICQDPLEHFLASKDKGEESTTTQMLWSSIKIPKPNASSEGYNYSPSLKEATVVVGAVDSPAIDVDEPLPE